MNSTSQSLSWFAVVVGLASLALALARLAQTLSVESLIHFLMWVVTAICLLLIFLLLRVLKENK